MGGGGISTNKYFLRSQVHALNILRALFRDTRLAEDVFPFIADGMKAAVQGYMSQLWSVCIFYVYSTLYMYLLSSLDMSNFCLYFMLNVITD